MPTKFEDQVAHFTSMFPGGFGDPLYLYQERDFVSAKGLPRHKTEASQLAQRLLAEDALDSLIAAGGAGLYAALRKIAAPVSILLSRFEAARFADQLKDADAELAIAVGLRELLYGAGPVASRFDAFAGKWRPDCARSWPILTLFPALGQPMEFVFVKPTYSRTQAAAIGRPIAVSGPLGKHYEEFLAVARDVRERLEQAHIPQRHDGFDLLDVYSFTLRSLIGKGYVGRSTLAPLRTYRAARTRGILLAPGAVLEPGAGEWKVLGTDGSARTVSLPHDRGALVARGDCVAIFATSQSQYPGPSWLSWPELENVAPGPDAAVCDEVVEFAAAADRVAWLGPESNGSQGD